MRTYMAVLCRKGHGHKYDTYEDAASDSIISSGNAMTQLKTTNSIKVKIEGDARVMEAEIKADQDRGIDTKDKEKNLSKLKGRITDVNEDLAEQADDAQEDVSSVSSKSSS